MLVQRQNFEGEKNTEERGVRKRRKKKGAEEKNPLIVAYL
jgi:hypothetical protein